MAPQLTVMQRIENLEKVNAELDQKLNSTFDKLRGQVGYVMEVVDALSTVLKQGVVGTADFDATVEKALLARREERKQERLAAENKQMANLVEMGVVSPSNSITPNSLLVGRSFDKNGEVQGIGREQFEFVNLHPQVKEQFLGKEVGFVFEANGNKMEVLEIYEIKPQNEEKSMPVATPSAVEVDSLPSVSELETTGA